MNPMGQQEFPTQCPPQSLGLIRQIYVPEGTEFLRKKVIPDLIFPGVGTFGVTLDIPIIIQKKTTFIC